MAKKAFLVISKFHPVFLGNYLTALIVLDEKS